MKRRHAMVTECTGMLLVFILTDKLISFCMSEFRRMHVGFKCILEYLIMEWLGQKAETIHWYEKQPKCTYFECKRLQ